MSNARTRSATWSAPTPGLPARLTHRPLRFFAAPADAPGATGTDAPDDDAAGGDAPGTGADAAATGADDLTKWKALARKHETQSKANADKARQFDELDAASKSDLQKANERADTAEQALAARTAADEAVSLRTEVAKAKGVAAGLLRGTTREELEEHADALLEALPKAPAVPPATGQGGAGADVHEDDDMSPTDVVKAALGR